MRMGIRFGQDGRKFNVDVFHYCVGGRNSFSFLPFTLVSEKPNQTGDAIANKWLNSALLRTKHEV